MYAELEAMNRKTLMDIDIPSVLAHTQPAGT